MEHRPATAIPTIPMTEAAGRSRGIVVVLVDHREPPPAVTELEAIKRLAAE